MARRVARQVWNSPAIAGRVRSRAVAAVVQPVRRNPPELEVVESQIRVVAEEHRIPAVVEEHRNPVEIHPMKGGEHRFAKQGQVDPAGLRIARRTTGH